MSIFSGANIVENGLVFNVDAGNIKSYPGSGNTWYDLTGNGIHATVDGATFSNNSFVFDGSTTYGSVLNGGFFNTANNFQSYTGFAWTVSVWFKFPISPITARTGNASYSLCGHSGGIGGGETFTLFVGSGTDATYGSYVPYYCALGIFGAKTIISPAPVNTNTWNNVVVTWNGSAGQTYFNGVDRGAYNVGAAALQTGYLFGIGQTGISTHYANTVQLFEGSIANYLVYNTAITAENVLQNFEAARGRFSI